VLNPPAAKALDYYPVMIENGIVKVDIGTIVGRSSFRKDQLQVRMIAMTHNAWKTTGLIATVVIVLSIPLSLILNRNTGELY
jgi:hypothetical protein